ncbi:MAG TPA: hypothetical protein VN478_02550 [Clostridia bacterium]|nr:hypothetical protein [Clostridia bacterium]
MKRVLTSTVLLLVVFVVFALVVGQFRDKPVALTVPFFATMHPSVEAVAYVSFFIGLLLATVIALAGDVALRKRFRAMTLDQSRHSKTSGGSDEIADTKAATVTSEHKPQG